MDFTRKKILVTCVLLFALMTVLPLDSARAGSADNRIDAKPDLLVMPVPFEKPGKKDFFILRAGTIDISDRIFNETEYLTIHYSLQDNFYRVDTPPLPLLDRKGMQGVGFYGYVPPGLTYELQYGNIDPPILGGFLKVFSNDSEFVIDNIDIDYAYMGSLKWETPIEGIVIGGSVCDLRMTATTTPTGVGMLIDSGMQEQSDEYRFNSIRTSVSSTEKLTGNLKLTAEYIQNKSESKYADISKRDQTGEGYFGGATYKLTDWLQLGSYYSIYYADKTDKKGEEWTAKGKKAAKAWIKDLALTTKIDLNEKWVLKLEGHLMDGLAGVDDLTEEEWMRFAAEMTISF